MPLRKFPLVSISLMLIVSTLFNACSDKPCDDVIAYTYYTPIYLDKEDVIANIKSGAPRAIEQTGKIYLRGNYIFLNEPLRGIHIIDNSNPSQPRNISFINIPGNIDMAVKGNILYADMFAQLIALDISNPQNVIFKKVVENVFPHTQFGFQQSDQYIADWVRHDTSFVTTCNRDQFEIALPGPQGQAVINFSSSVSSGGIGGSMARFTLIKDRLYTVARAHLNVFDASTPEALEMTGSAYVGQGIETIYPFKDRLFIGSSVGMYIYDVTSPDQPEFLSQFTHALSCDPVIADDQYAYVTLRSGNNCNSTINQLEVLDIADLAAPQLIKTYQMQNPHGLSKDGKWLFICDGAAGVKLYDASDPNNIKFKSSLAVADAYDVILYNKRALVVGKKGIYQFDYTNANAMRQLSVIRTGKP